MGVGAGPQRFRDGLAKGSHSGSVSPAWESDWSGRGAGLGGSSRASPEKRGGLGASITVFLARGLGAECTYS